MIRRELLPGLHSTPFDAHIGRHRAVAFATTPLSSLHDAAHSLAGATVNDAVLAVIAAHRADGGNTATAHSAMSASRCLRGGRPALVWVRFGWDDRACCHDCRRVSWAGRASWRRHATCWIARAC